MKLKGKEIVVDHSFLFLNEEWAWGVVRREE
jgi:hypothetical protein